ncbi:MAG: hypothetical protein IT299_04435 [Dehalococcoidia bacterium]|nr:hypothetical protein [Dehalococcoidia bacterium]
MSHRTWMTATFATWCLLVAACGGETAPTVDRTDVATKGVTDKTGSGSSSSSGSTASKAATGKKLPGGVCQLLTVAEVEAVVKSGQTLTTVESAPDPTSERSCIFVVAGAAPIVALSLQGELEPLDWPAIKALPGAKTVSARGGEAVFWPTTNVLYVQKNGLAVTVQVVVAPSGETVESASSKLAQPIVDRLP